MDQLKQQLQERAGLSADQAEKAIALFTEFLSNHLSDDQLQSVAAKVPGIGQYADKLPQGAAKKISGMLGGFGKKQE